MIWDEAVKINGADPDFHRRDLFEAIAKGDFPEWEFGIQAFDEEQADSFDFDILDRDQAHSGGDRSRSKSIGRMVLDRNADNFFAETEQAAFHPGNVVPGIDFTNDPLLQGRLFSYTDTQLSRLGGPNFHELPINRPRCPMRNFQRDGIAPMEVAKGRVAYEPNSLDPTGPARESRARLSHLRGAESRERARATSCAFGRRASPTITARRACSSAPCRSRSSATSSARSPSSSARSRPSAIRRRMLGHLHDHRGGARRRRSRPRSAWKGQAETSRPAREPIDLEPSPSAQLGQEGQADAEGAQGRARW